MEGWGSASVASGVCLHPWAALRVVGARLESAYQGATSESSAAESASTRRLVSGCGDLAAQPDSATTNPPGCCCTSGVWHQALGVTILAGLLTLFHSHVLVADAGPATAVDAPLHAGGL